MQLTRNVFGPDYDPVSQPLHPNVESEYHVASGAILVAEPVEK